jgi:hypothetical protein
VSAREASLFYCAIAQQISAVPPKENAMAVGSVPGCHPHVQLQRAAFVVSAHSMALLDAMKPPGGRSAA